VTAECLFVDPISDIAALGPPDAQVLYDDSEAYDALVKEACTALPIATPTKLASARLLSLAGEWIQCEVRSFAPRLWITSDSSRNVWISNHRRTRQGHRHGMHQLKRSESAPR
jgi:hypothetical protein